MKKVILFLLLFTFQIASSQEQLSQTEKLASLCKVWGFLKYYHPNVAKGNYNWDEQLMTVLPKIEQATSKEKLSKVYIDWINGLGNIKECKSCKNESKKEYFEKNFDLSWTQNPNLFSDELSKKFKYIEENRFQGKNHYVTATNNDNIEVRNEPKYENFEFPTENYRLLSLFRYWNTVEYFYPYKYLTDQQWDDVLCEMIPKYLNSKNASQYHLSMLETTVKIDDSHSVFKTNYTINYFGSKSIPAKLKIIDNKAIVTGFLNDSLSEINHLKIGDIIEKIEGVTIKEILEERFKYIPGSNYNSKARLTYYNIINGNSEKVNITLNHNGISSNRLISRYSYDLIFKKEPLTEEYKILNGNIGYVNMAVLEMKEVDKMMEELNNTKGIIFDMRNYPTFIPYLITNYLNSEKKDFLKTTIPDLSYPGKFIWKEAKNSGKNNKGYYKGKVVLLVNEQTQSRAEYSAMLLQTANNVTTMGSQTAGADGNVSKVEFIGGYTALISGTGIYYPDGTQTQRKGIKIDIEIKPTIKGIQEGRDEVLEKAIEIIDSK